MGKAPAGPNLPPPPPEFNDSEQANESDLAKQVASAVGAGPQDGVTAALASALTVKPPIITWKSGAHPDPSSSVPALKVAPVEPETPTLEAIELMRKNKVSCLPVTQEGKLVGIVSERDFMPIAYQLLEERLREAED